MTASVRVILPQSLTPTFKLSTRAAPDTLLSTIYTGVAISGRPTVYAFTTAVADGEYAITQLEYPYAVGVVDIVGTTANVYGTFEEMDAAAGGGGSTTVLPVIGYVDTSISETTVPLFVGDTSTRMITCVDSSGGDYDVEALTLVIVVETKDKVDVSVIADGDLTKSANTVTFTPTAEMVESRRVLRFALRQTSDNAVIVYGIMPVTYAPQED